MSKDLQAKKLAMIDGICKNLQKKFGAESVNYLGNKEVVDMPRVSSGIVIVDEITGGGYPLGRIIEVYGDASTGKTTLCYHALAAAQKAFPDKFCAFIDSEFAYDKNYSRNIGVNVNELVVSQPDDGQDAFAIMQGLIEAGAAMIVVDSVAAMVPREEVEEEDFGKHTIGLQARMMSKALRKLTSIISKHQCIVLFTNQTRTNVGVMYGDNTTTAGGNALKFYSSIRIKTAKFGAALEEGAGVNKSRVGINVRVECVKNKTAAPFKRSEGVIVFGEGFDNESAYINSLISSGVIERRGAGWLYYKGEKILQGANNLKGWLEENPEKYEQMKEDLSKVSNLSEDFTPEPSEGAEFDIDSLESADDAFSVGTVLGEV